MIALVKSGNCIVRTTNFDYNYISLTTMCLYKEPSSDNLILILLNLSPLLCTCRSHRYVPTDAK